MLLGRLLCAEKGREKLANNTQRVRLFKRSITEMAMIQGQCVEFTAQPNPAH